MIMMVDADDHHDLAISRNALRDGVGGWYHCYCLMRAVDNRGNPGAWRESQHLDFYPHPPFSIVL